MSKTKYMAINSNPCFQISISNEQMRQMDHFKYLRVWVTKKEVELEKKNWNEIRIGNEIKNRKIEQSWMGPKSYRIIKFDMMKQKHTQVKRHIGRSMVEFMVESILYYGSEVDHKCENEKEI